jgi:hypothetical protein
MTTIRVGSGTVIRSVTGVEMSGFGSQIPLCQYNSVPNEADDCGVGELWARVAGVSIEESTNWAGRVTDICLLFL